MHVYVLWSEHCFGGRLCFCVVLTRESILDRVPGHYHEEKKGALSVLARAMRFVELTSCSDPPALPREQGVCWHVTESGLRKAEGPAGGARLFRSVDSARAWPGRGIGGVSCQHF